jgi:hypothetical protein
MTTSSDEKQPNLNATAELRDCDSEADGAFAGDLEPTFLDDEGPSFDVPLFITRTNARGLLDLRPGETVAYARAYEEPRHGGASPQPDQ